jgi:RNA recognition motif-containing protein
MNNILVENLHPNVTEQNIRPLFENHGAVKRFKLITDHFTGLSGGFVFIEMKIDVSLGGHPKPAIEGHFKTGQR